MLGSDDFDNLAAWFVDGGLFGEMLRKWELDDSRAWYTKTTPQTRKQVAADLRNDSELAKKISRMVLQIVTSCGEEYQIFEWQYIISYNGPFPEWNVNEDRWKVKSNEEKKIDAHLHFVSEVNDYLNLITVCGVDTRAACAIMISCVQQHSDGTFHFNQGMLKDKVDHIQTEQKKKARQDELKNKQRQAELEQARESALSETRHQLNERLGEMKHLELEDLIDHCTDGLEVVEGDDDVFNMFKVMNGFKQAALTLLNVPATLTSNHKFLKLIETTYRNIWHAESRVSIPADDPRVEHANSILTLVNLALQQQRKQLEEQRDATPDTAPPTEPNAQPDATPRPEKTFSLIDPRTWRRRAQPSQELTSPQCRVACLLRQLDECK